MLQEINEFLEIPNNVSKESIAEKAGTKETVRTYIDEAIQDFDLPKKAIYIGKCPVLLRLDYPGLDGSTYSFDAKKPEGCRGMTCEECWNQPIKR